MANNSIYDNGSPYDTSYTYDAYAPQPIVPTPVSVPHLSAMLTLSPDGSFAYVEQDTLDDISQCVEMILSTPKGQRTMIPALGFPDPTFQYPVDKNQMNQIIQTFEPRADVSINISYAEGQTNVQVAVATKRGTAI